MYDKILVMYRDTRFITYQGKKLRVEVDAKLSSHSGQKPRFSVTASLHEKARNNRWVEAGGGCCHAQVLKAFPKLAPVIALHSSDENGVPMGAVENAFYHAGGCGRDLSTKVGLDKAVIRTALKRVACTEDQENAIWEVLGIAEEKETEWHRWDGTPNAEVLAIHLRIGSSTAVALCESVVLCKMTKENMSAYVDALRPMWKKEAEAAVALLKELALKKEVDG